MDKKSQREVKKLKHAVCCLKKEIGGENLPQSIIDALLAATTPDGTNYFVTLQDIENFITEEDLEGIGTGTTIGVVVNYSTLPDPTTVPQEFYWVSNTQGTKWLPGILGGTFYNSGLYYSNGVSWEYLEVPYQATQTEVDAGINTDKFVTPATLSASTYVVDFFIGILFENVATWTYIAPQDFIINSIDNPNGINYSIIVNGVVYTLGDVISLYDEVEISGDIVGFLKLNCKLN
jgi:hypothetical protein